MSSQGTLWPWFGDAATSIVTWIALNAAMATVLFVVATILIVVLRPRSALVRTALWFLVLLRLVLPPGLSHPASFGAVLHRLLPAVEIGRGFELASLQVVDPERRDGRGAEPAHEAAASTWASVNSWSTAVVIVWLSGAVFVLLLGRRRLALVRHAIQTSSAAHEPWQLEMIQQWRHQLGIRRQVELRITAAPLVPFTTGVLRPRVVLPRDLVVHGRRTAVESVIAHELAHVARLDSLWSWLQQLLQVVYFFHPLVWISNVCLCHEREQLCDARVLAQGRLEPRAYAQSLLEVLQLRLHGVHAPAFAPHHRRLAMRLHSILDHRPATGLRTTLAAATMIVVGLFLLPMAVPGTATSAPNSSTPALAAASVPALPTEPSGPTLINPLPGSRVTQPWGRSHNPFTGTVSHHNGIDLAAPAGTTIRAAGSATVAVATEHYTDSGAWGHVVVLDHGNGLTTLYAHLGELLVTAGETVEQGQPIARVGSTGRSTGPHLHLEIRRDNQPEDPASFVSGWSGNQPTKTAGRTNGS